MNSGFRSQCIPSYRLLTEGQIKEIHLATLKVLETTGVRVMHEEGRELLRSAGCRVGEDGVVCMPSWLVEECIRSAPSSVPVCSRDGKEAMRLEGRKIHYGIGTDLINTYDLHTGEIRMSVLQDVVNAAIIADACDQIDFIASYALASDMPTNSMYLECFKAQVENSTKPVFFTAAGVEDLSAIIQIAAAIAGGEDELRQKPFLIHYSEPTPPLTHSFGAVGKLFLCADKGVPIMYAPALLMGGSAPITLAGAIIQANAEALSGIVLHQLRAKGAPVISGFAATVLDLRTMVATYGSPDFRLTNSACADVYHYYGIPMWSTVGTDAAVFDQQASLEHGVLHLMAALDGANLIHDVGYMGQGLVGNPAALVMSNELIGYVKRVLRGFELTPETMALDAIHAVGPGGNYLSHESTLAMFRKEIWRPSYLNREDPEVWLANGGKTYGQVLTERALEILATHKPERLPEGIQREVDQIASQAAKVLEGVSFTA